MAAGGDVSGADPAPATASVGMQLVPGGLSWPEVRGARLLRLLTPCDGDEALESEGEGEAARLSDMSARSASASALGFELEMCIPAPGHVALVLARRSAGGGGTVSTASTPTAAGQPQQRDGGAETAASAPRVVYVMDAVPPKTAASTRSQASDATTSNGSSISTSSSGATSSIPPDTRRTTSTPVPSKAGGAASSPSSTATATPIKPKGGRFALSSMLLSQQDVDEVELIEELLAVPRATGSDGTILAKAPLLCVRFDCRVVGVRFVGAEAPKVSTAGTSAPLRCVVAREDGMAFLWEWRADLHQWTFMNRFCFLENPNLSWTKPVVAFTATQSAEQLDRQLGGVRGSSLHHHRSGISSAGAYGTADGEEEAGGPMELAWWSTEVRHEPKLWQRSVRFVRETNTFRTDVVVGSAHAILPASCTDVTTLLTSKLGLWALSATAGIFFRSASLLSTLSMSWAAATTVQGSASGVESARSNDSTSATFESVAACPHNVTGELLVVHRATGSVFLVSPPQSSLSSHKSLQLRSKKLTTLTPWQGEGHDVKEIVGHRHLLLILTEQPNGSAMLYIHSLVTGKRLESVALPSVSLTMPPMLMPTALSSPTSGSSNRLSSPLQLWVLAGKASAVGLWSPSSLWTLRLPSAKQVAAAHRSVQQDPTAAFVTVKDYGESSRLDAALFALDSLEQAVTVVASAESGSDGEGDPSRRVDDSDPKWQAAVASMSNPAVLLALLTSGSRRMPKAIIDELAALVGAVHDAAQELKVGGRGTFVRKNSSRTGSSNRQDDDGDVGIDKEVVAAAGRRLVTPANLESLEQLANWILLAKRKVARLHSTAFANDSATGVSARVSLAEQQRMRARNQVERTDDDLDASNFRLSRKLRPMSNLRFAAQSCALGAHGKQWLAQLEAFLLANVSFKEGQDGGQDRSHVAMPNHLLFHEERVLDDYARHGGAPSFSKHMYLESMSRLYLLHEPESLVAFVECVERFCPRLFTLAGRANVAKSHAERALALLPPASLFVERVNKSVVSKAESESARASLVAYVQLLCHCEQWVEASRALLDCDMYERCKSLVLAPLVGRAEGDESKASAAPKKPDVELEDEKVKADRLAATASVYFALVEHCVRRRYDADELAALVKRKPPQVVTLTLLRALRGWLEAAAGEGGGGGGEGSTSVTVGKLRSVLSALLTTKAQQSAVR